jgi:DNA polymerase III subunit beta
MKFIINAQTLQTELAFLSGIVANKSNTIPVLQNIIIASENVSSLKISGTDLDVSLSCQTEAAVSEPGTILVPMGKLLAITKTLPKTADMTFQSLENGGAKLTCERASFKLMAPEFEAFPEIQEPKEGAIEIPTDIFSNMIASTIYAITQEESRYTLSGAKVEIDESSMRMITTDGHRLAKSENKEITSKTTIDVLIPRKALAELARICAAHQGTLRFTTDPNHIYFQVGSRSLSARLLSGQFPNYEMVIPKANDNSFATDVTAFREAVRRVSLMADDRSHAIRLDIKAGQLNFSASTPDNGEALESIPIDFNGEETSIGFNSQYLLDSYNALGHQDLVTLSFKDGNSQVMLVPGAALANQSLAVIMPCRL